MFLLFVALFTILLVILSYLWYEYKKTSNKISWIPEVEGLPVLGVTFRFGKTTEFLQNLSEFIKAHDGFCWMNLALQPIILVSNDKHLEYFLSTTNILDKSTEYYPMHRWLGFGLLTAPGPLWKRNRKILTPAFHFSILETFIDVFESKSNIMVDLLKGEANGNIVNIYPYVTMCSLDIISEAAMGVTIDAQMNIHSEYVTAVKEMCRIIVERGFYPMKRFNLTYSLTSDYCKELKYVKTLHTFTESVIDQRVKERSGKVEKINGEEEGKTKKKAFLDLLLDFISIEGQSLTREEIRQEVDTFMFEGHDTTASAISFSLYCLANNPEVQDTILDEQRLIFENNPNRAVNYRDLQSMKYLELAIKESLRMYPSVPFFARRTHEDVVYKDGNIIPKNINIILYAYGANMNPKTFKNPEIFDPSRFDESSTSRSPYSYIPFSAGPRNCIGQKFAMLELKSVISKVVRNYVLETAGPEHKVILAAETVLKSQNGVNIRLRKREW